MSTDGRRGNRGDRGRGRGPRTRVSGETRRGQVPIVPEENPAPGGNQGIRPPSGPRGNNPQTEFIGHPPRGPRPTQPGGFGVASSPGSSESHAGQSSNEPRADQPSGGSWGDPSASSSRGYGGQPPHEPRANPPRGGPRGGYPRGGTRGGRGEPLGSDKRTGGDPIFK